MLGRKVCHKSLLQVEWWNMSAFKVWSWFSNRHLMHQTYRKGESRRLSCNPGVWLKNRLKGDPTVQRIVEDDVLKNFRLPGNVNSAYCEDKLKQSEIKFPNVIQIGANITKRIAWLNNPLPVKSASCLVCFIHDILIIAQIYAAAARNPRLHNDSMSDLFYAKRERACKCMQISRVGSGNKWPTWYPKQKKTIFACIMP